MYTYPFITNKFFYSFVPGDRVDSVIFTPSSGQLSFPDRIRNVGTTGTPEYLMTMHGMFWHFPANFSSGHYNGIRPRSAYLKVIGDFTRWNGRLVFGCDDSAQKGFLNKRKAKGGIEGPGQSNSNLWFTSEGKIDSLGPATASGAVWFYESVNTGDISETYLFAGWSKRCAWILNEGNQMASFNFETGIPGEERWENIKKVNLKEGEGAYVDFDESQSGEWIRVESDAKTDVTVIFNYTGKDSRGSKPAEIFDGLADVTLRNVEGGLLYGLGNDRRALGIAAIQTNEGEEISDNYYELDENLRLQKKDDPETLQFIRDKFSIPSNAVSIDEASVLVVDDKGRRWRLPKGKDEYDLLNESARLRICREVSTERDLFSCHGTFYELPAENADGFARIRPVASHHYRITDYASYRGMLIMTGVDPGYKRNNKHIIRSQDGQFCVWAGVIDDLWSLGKPSGKGGPWKNTRVKAFTPSDPYLIGFYVSKKLTLSHSCNHPVKFIIETDPSGEGPWIRYMEVVVPAHQIFTFKFPENFQARWIRFSTDQDCMATTWLEYD